MSKMVDVEVEYNYDAEQTDELSIKVGDVIRNVSMVEGGWWEGELNGKKGMFPDNFVKVIQKQEKDVKKDEGKKKDVQATKRQSVRDLANKLKGQVHEGPPLIRKKAEPGAKKKRAKVVYSYDPENDDELKLEVGDMVDILKQEEEGWWEGILNGRQGVFPSNFVEIAEESENAEPTGTDNKIENTEEHMIKGKKIQGIGLGNIFGDGPIKLRKTGEKKPMEKPAEAPKAGKREDLAHAKPRDTKPIEKAQVRYSYTAENEDELTLTEGDIVNVLDKELEDSGWWKGEMNGRIGVFPDNFVELIKEERHSKRSSAHISSPLSNHSTSHVKSQPASVTPAPQPKPKKPPPPSQPAAPKPVAPKLPDKAPVIEHTKPEPQKEDKPVIHTKKPIHPPPPITKKPIKPIDSVSKEEKREEPRTDSHGFESVEPTADKLTHLTASRARGPQKRPPSQVLFQNPKKNVDTINEDEDRNGEVTVKEEKSHQIHSKLDKEDQVNIHQVGGKLHPVTTRPPENSAATASLQQAIEELRKEMNDLRANTVSKTVFNELKAENENLKQEIDTVKSTCSRRLRDIMAEVDEEKKIRLSTQVEMERIRKIVSESHV